MEEYRPQTRVINEYLRKRALSKLDRENDGKQIIAYPPMIMHNSLIIEASSKREPLSHTFDSR